MRLPPPPLLVSALVCATACGGDAPTASARGDYVLRLFGFPELMRGQPLRLKLKLRDGSSEVAGGGYQGSIRPDGTQEIALRGVLEEGRAYRVDYYVDLDRDGAYTPPSGAGFRDPSWRRFVTGASRGVSDSQAHGDPFVDLTPF